MSSTSLITLPLLIKLWILGVLFYIIHNTTTEFKVSTRNQILIYIVIGTLGYYGSSLSLTGNSKALQMNREESELVKDYLKHRRRGETLGEFLTRMEAEEEEAEMESEIEMETETEEKSMRGKERKSRGYSDTSDRISKSQRSGVKKVRKVSGR